MQKNDAVAKMFRVYSKLEIAYTLLRLLSMTEGELRSLSSDRSLTVIERIVSSGLVSALENDNMGSVFGILDRLYGNGSQTPWAAEIEKMAETQKMSVEEQIASMRDLISRLESQVTAQITHKERPKNEDYS